MRSSVGFTLMMTATLVGLSRGMRAEYVWSSQPAAGQRNWLGIASSQNGMKLAAANYDGE